MQYSWSHPQTKIGVDESQRSPVIRYDLTLPHHFISSLT